LCAVPVCAQLDSNTITVTVTRTSSPAPDQVVFGVAVTSGLNASLDDVVAALAGSGITTANFTGVSAPIVQPPFAATQVRLSWNFTVAAPLANMKQTSAMLITLAQNFSKAHPDMTVSIMVNSFQVSPQLQERQACAPSTLLPDATTQAQQFATAAGFSLGPLLSMSSTASTPASGCTVTVKFSVTRSS
jgi:hypothetical protein